MSQLLRYQLLKHLMLSSSSQLLLRYQLLKQKRKTRQRQRKQTQQSKTLKPQWQQTLKQKQMLTHLSAGASPCPWRTG